MSVARNLLRRRGKAVLTAEIAACAKPTCQLCSGSGMTRIKRPGAADFTEMACSCAATRFLRRHPQVIVSEEGYAWWPAPESEQPVSAPAAPLGALAELPDAGNDDVTATGPAPEALRLDRLLGLRDKAAAELAAAQAGLDADRTPYSAQADAARRQWEEARQVQAGLVRQREDLARDLVKAKAKADLCQRALWAVDTEKLPAVHARVAAAHEAVEAAEKTWGAAGKPHRRKLLVAQARVDQLDKRIKRLQVYNGPQDDTHTHDLPNQGTGPEAA